MIEAVDLLDLANVFKPYYSFSDNVFLLSGFLMYINILYNYTLLLIYYRM